MKYEKMNKKIIIKKYENRRLYDVTHSRYVNLDEIARAVQDEYDVQVLDASTGEDITRFVMTQIITEHAKAPDSVFPLDILRQMVVASGKASQESTFNYMRAVADMYKHALRGLSKSMSPFEVMQSLINAEPGAPAEQQLSPEQVAAAGGQGTVQVLPQAAAPSQAAEKQEHAEIRDLKRRIHELEAMVANLNKTPAPRKKKTKSKPAGR
jgi:polyhydroxyalkanoate synthesis repressor PhaR